jgi:hypothetical protein
VGGGRATRRSGTLVVLCFFLTVAARAQVAPNRATLYLHPTEVSDARALWVNPAGLGRFEEASLHLDLTVGDPGASGRLRQVTIGVNSRGLSFGYQRDLFDGGVRGGTYRVGFAAGHGGFAGGAAAALYRGGGSSSGWDAGVVYDCTPLLTVGGVIQNIGQPHVRDSTLRVTYVPSATLQLLERRVALSGLGRLTADGVRGYAFSVRATLRQGTALPIGLTARLDTDRSLHRAGFAFGFSLGGLDAAGLVATTPGDLGRIAALSLYGVSTRRFAR